jgi:hypothetical protein
VGIANWEWFQQFDQVSYLLTWRIINYFLLWRSGNYKKYASKIPKVSSIGEFSLICCTRKNWASKNEILASFLIHCLLWKETKKSKYLPVVAQIAVQAQIYEWRHYVVRIFAKKESVREQPEGHLWRFLLLKV